MFLNFKEAFTFMFKDEKFWQKYAIGTLINILPFITMAFFFIMFNNLGKNPSLSEFLVMFGLIMIMSISCFIMFFSIGYCVNYANAKITTGINELPEWSGNFKSHFIEGIKLWAGLLLIGVCAGTIFWIIEIIIGIVAGIAGIAIGLNGASKTAMAIAIVVLAIAVIAIFSVLYFLFLMYLYLAISSFLVDKNVLAVCNFKIIKVLSKNNLLNMIFILLLFIPIILFSLLLFISPILYFSVLTVTNFYIMLVFYNLLAQYVQIGTKKNQARIEEKKAQENLQENPR